MTATHDEMSIHIDKQQHKSPNPTTGSALYALGKVRSDYDLYRETKGPGDDVLIPNDTTPVQLKPGDHFFSAQRSLNPGSVYGANRV